MMRKTWSNVKILLKHHTTQCGVVLPHPHGDGVAAGVRGVYPTATPSPRLRVPRDPAHAVGGVPARGIPPLDATAGAYVTSIDTFYVQY